MLAACIVRAGSPFGLGGKLVFLLWVGGVALSVPLDLRLCGFCVSCGVWFFMWYMGRVFGFLGVSPWGHLWA